MKSERENLWKKHKRVKIEEDKKYIESQIAEISKKVTPLAEEIKHCNNIELRLERIKQYELHQKLKDKRKQAEKQNEKREKDKERFR